MIGLNVNMKKHKLVDMRANSNEKISLHLHTQLSYDFGNNLWDHLGNQLSCQLAGLIYDWIRCENKEV
jgi:hypothetical protein